MEVEESLPLPQLSGMTEMYFGRNIPDPGPTSAMAIERDGSGIRSWVKIAQSAGTTTNSEWEEALDLPDLPVKEIEGRKTLVIPIEAKEQLSLPFRWSAIAGLSGGNPRVRVNLADVFQDLRKMWSSFADTRFTMLQKGLFLIRVKSERELEEILLPGRWKVKGRYLVASQWQLGMPLKLEAVSRVPLWIRLPELPMHMWNRKVFIGISKLIGGIFLDADGYTKTCTSRLQEPQPQDHSNKKT